MHCRVVHSKWHYGESVSPISRYRAGWAAKKRQSCSSSRLTLQCSRCGAGSASFASFQLCLSFKGKSPPEERGEDDGGHENHEGDEDLDLVLRDFRSDDDEDNKVAVRKRNW